MFIYYAQKIDYSTAGHILNHIDRDAHQIESLNPGQIRLQNGHFSFSAMVSPFRSKIMVFLAVLERSWGKKSSKIGLIFTIYRFFLFQEQVSHLRL